MCDAHLHLLLRAISHSAGCAGEQKTRLAELEEGAEEDPWHDEVHARDKMGVPPLAHMTSDWQ